MSKIEGYVLAALGLVIIMLLALIFTVTGFGAVAGKAITSALAPNHISYLNGIYSFERKDCNPQDMISLWTAAKDPVLLADASWNARMNTDLDNLEKCGNDFLAHRNIPIGYEAYDSWLIKEGYEVLGAVDNERLFLKTYNINYIAAAAAHWRNATTDINNAKNSLPTQSTGSGG
jgi:hypothetical protein